MDASEALQRRVYLIGVRLMSAGYHLGNDVLRSEME
jgi:hypothetical protein